MMEDPADLVVVTMTDLLPHLDFDMDKLRKHIREVNPEVPVIELSARNGEGMEKWFDYLRKTLESVRESRSAGS
ncbi:MAG: hypothetical protein QGG80_02880 [Candidatus Krumholzibacteria bacterium]|jgi:hydrogenase nickel incorporation protein HypB|nr:hypothetical protein [Candidatus Krumholzibacteria bacterium]